MSISDNHYRDLKNAPYDHPCKRCGATKRDENGHDPCISNLPGVLHACCGHGVQDGYLMLENGLTIRGNFELERKDRTFEINCDWFPELKEKYNECRNENN